MKKHLMLTFLFISILVLRANAQQVIQASFSADAWNIDAKKHEFTTYQGKKSLYLEHGKARLKNSSFKNGIIDFDINFSAERKFVGVHFRSKDMKTFEEFYLRPHLSGKPDAMQYTPVFNGIAAWQLYHGKGYSGVVNHAHNTWTHVRLIVANDRMDVFVGDMSKPVLHVHDLKLDAKAGEVGFGTFLGGAYYANLSYQPLEKAQLVSEISPLPQVDQKTVMEWNISQAFDGKKLDAIQNLNDFDVYKNTNWTKLKAEYSGIINLAQLSEVNKNTNTVFVKVNIHSEKAQIRKIDFGYSDFVRVYANQAIVYVGNNGFRTRDYRYLGTIGYFDTIYLNLQKGNNEVIFAVTERMGGWGLKAKLDSLEDILLSSN